MSHDSSLPDDMYRAERKPFNVNGFVVGDRVSVVDPEGLPSGLKIGTVVSLSDPLRDTHEVLVTFDGADGDKQHFVETKSLEKIVAPVPAPNPAVNEEGALEYTITADLVSAVADRISDFFGLTEHDVATSTLRRYTDVLRAQEAQGARLKEAEEKLLYRVAATVARFDCGDDDVPGFTDAYRNKILAIAQAAIDEIREADDEERPW